jgi:hypothetical protein
VNSVSLRIGASTTAAVLLGALLFATVGASPAGAQPFGRDGVIHACFKAKGRNRGALRVVASQGGCRKLRGWRPMSWSATGFSGGAGGAGPRGATGVEGPAGEPGPRGETGQQGVAGEVEQSLLDTVQSQTSQIEALTEEVSDLANEVVDLEETVESACAKIPLLAEHSDETAAALVGSSVGGILGAVFNVPNPPDPLGTVECNS